MGQNETVRRISLVAEDPSPVIDSVADRATDESPRASIESCKSASAEVVKAKREREREREQIPFHI
jgi:hypothetical protein